VRMGCSKEGDVEGRWWTGGVVGWGLTSPHAIDLGPDALLFVSCSQRDGGDGVAGFGGHGE